jgi:adenylate kinase
MLAERLGWKLFSSGNHFKGLIDAAGPLSDEIRKDYTRGQLSPDWLAAYFFEESFLDLDPAMGIVSEGFPRTLPQAHLTDEILTWLHRPYKVIHLKVDEEEALRRQLSRASTEDRPDSNTDEKIHTRFDVYRTRTEPIIDFFRGNGALIEIDGEQTPEAIAEQIDAALDIQ